MVLLKTLLEGNLLIVVDNLAVVLQWAKGSIDYATHRDGDIWGEYWQCCDHRQGSVILFWYRSHMSVSVAIQLGIPGTVHLANHCADIFAVKGTEDCQASNAQKLLIQHVKDEVLIVQNRLVEIAVRCASFKTQERESKTVRLSAPSTISAIRESSHNLSAVYVKGLKRWRCSVCLKSAPPTRVLEFSKSRCTVAAPVVDPQAQVEVQGGGEGAPGVVQGVEGIHPTHAVRFRKGLQLCAVCGAYGASKPYKLSLECTHPRTHRNRGGSGGVGNFVLRRVT